MNIYKSEFLDLNFSPEKSLFYFTWLETTSEMDEDDYKTQMLNYLEEVKKYKPVNLLVDDRKMNFLISITLQEWIGENVFPVSIEFGMKAFAVVMNEDIIQKITVEQSVRENPEPNALKNAFFENIEEAEQWLLSQEWF